MGSKHLKPQFFVTRQNGNMVPLIAMDELPPSIRIHDVKRTLSPHDISGMTGVGIYGSRHVQHIIEGPTQPPLIDQNLPASGYSPQRSFVDPSFQSCGFHIQPKSYGIQEQAPKSTSYQPDSDRVNQQPSSISSLPAWHDLPSHGLQPAAGVKEYCSYWLRHGECDYAQQGCLYKHEMPLDKATLQRLGLRDVPKWYREKYGISSHLAVSGGKIQERREEELMDRDWRNKGQGEGEGVGTSNADGTYRPLQTMPPVLSTGQEAATSGATRVRIRNSAKPSIPRSTQIAKAKVKNVREHQMMETLAQLDAYEQREAERKADLEERMRCIRMGSKKDVLPTGEEFFEGTNEVEEEPKKQDVDLLVDL